nr:DUF433 domain-containing protein [uncultured Dyadobacter sp.]
MGIGQIVTTDPGILNGQPVFSGTRVPIESLFDHLETGISLDEFLNDFPTVSREQAVALLERAYKPLPLRNINATGTAVFENTKSGSRTSGDL